MDEITEEEVTKFWDEIHEDDTTPMGDNALEDMADLNKGCKDD